MFWCSQLSEMSTSLGPCLSICLKGQKSQRSLFEGSKCICHCHCHCLCICLGRCLLVGQVTFSHRSDHMSQSSKVSKIALWRHSLNVFVIIFVIVIVIVFLFVNVFLFVRLCFLITLIKCLKSLYSRVALCMSKVKVLSESVSEWVSDKGKQWWDSGPIKNINSAFYEIWRKFCSLQIHFWSMTIVWLQ